MADVNYKGEKQYRRFPRDLCPQDIEDSPIGETVAKWTSELLWPSETMRRMRAAFSAFHAYIRH